MSTSTTRTSRAETRLAHPADRLLAAVEAKGSPVCVGIDPVLDRLPAPLRPDVGRPEDIARAFRTFGEGVLHAIRETIPCVKFQSACFERYGAPGVEVLARLIDHAADLGFHIILDAKRGDIGITAEHYAAAAFAPQSDSPADWITVNAYLGADGIRPFLTSGGGAFALVRTSNPSGDSIQALQLEDGRNVAEAVADLIAETGSDWIGERGYSALSAVVAATRSEEIASLRARMPQQIFLVPGFGAQGGSVQDVLPCFRPDGTGALITASRSVIYAFDGDGEWADAIAEAAGAFAEQIRGAVSQRLNR